MFPFPDEARALTTISDFELVDVIFDGLLVEEWVKNVHVPHVALVIFVHQLGGIVGATIGIESARMISLNGRIRRPKAISPERLCWWTGRIIRSPA